MAIEFDYLPLTHSEVPVQKTFTIGNTYVFEFYYNTSHDFYTMYIRDEDENLLYTTKVVYGNSLYHAVVDGLELSQDIIPFDIQDLISEKSIANDSVNSENLDNPVRIYLVDG
jgi:hypothetical protein